MTVVEENRAIKHIEKRYMTESRKKTYIACERFNFQWCETQVMEFDRLWKQGLSRWDLAQHFDRDMREIDMLIYDRAELGKIKPRKNGIYRN